MTKLSDRLQLIADQIQKGETMADIGTDHGFLPIYLREEDICPQVIMTDISEPSLQKAKGYAGAFQFGSEMDFRAGNGLQVLESGEVDNVVIAGMGGILMTEILGDDIAKSRSFKRFVFQPRNHSEILRWWLTKNGFIITDNLLVREGKFICEIIVARPADTDAAQEDTDYRDEPDGKSCGIPPENDICWILPDDLGANDPDLRREYIQRLQHTEEKILAGMKKSKETDEEAMRCVEERIEYLKGV